MTASPLLATRRRTSPPAAGSPRSTRGGLAAVWQYRWLYLMILPTIVYFVVFAYLPMIGLQIAFKDFKVFSGMWASPWVGFEHFQAMFASEKFPELLRNTLLLSLYRIVFGFPVPIIFALLLNEVRRMWFKRTVQTVTYFPHFLSWVVFAGIVVNILGPTGIVNTLLIDSGGDRINFLTNPDTFRSVLVLTGIMKEFGWGAIIYLAALVRHRLDVVRGGTGRRCGSAAADLARDAAWPAAHHGGAPRAVVGKPSRRRVRPGLPALQRSRDLDVADIIDTWVYRVGLLDAQFELATAVGLFKGVVGMVLIVTANHVLRRMGQRSLWGGSRDRSSQPVERR